MVMTSDSPPTWFFILYVYFAKIGMIAYDQHPTKFRR